MSIKFLATLRDYRRSKADGGFVVSFDVDESQYNSIVGLPVLKDDILYINVDTEKSKNTQETHDGIPGGQ